MYFSVLFSLCICIYDMLTYTYAPIQLYSRALIISHLCLPFIKAVSFAPAGHLPDSEAASPPMAIVECEEGMPPQTARKAALHCTNNNSSNNNLNTNKNHINSNNRHIKNNTNNSICVYLGSYRDMYFRDMQGFGYVLPKN